MKKILIVTGDPNSINSEIIYKTWKKINKKIKKRIYIISNYKLLKSQFEKLNYSIKMLDVKKDIIKISRRNSPLTPFPPPGMRKIVTSREIN